MTPAPGSPLPRRLLTVLAVAALSVTAAPAASARGDMPPQDAITAPVVKLEFARPMVKTIAAPLTPDEKLIKMMSVTRKKPVVAASKGTLSAPLASMKMVSPFGTRQSPLGPGTDFHSGEDFAASCGTDVHAAAAGKVTFAGVHAFGGGNRVVIEHTDGLKTTYNHLQEITVKPGWALERGDALGTVGSTGASTGCHLHFEVELNNKMVDPAGWL